MVIPALQIVSQTNPFIVKAPPNSEPQAKQETPTSTVDSAHLRKQVSQTQGTAKNKKNIG